MLYLVATPIGNLEDITYRAVRILGEVSLIAAEDTRHTRKLLNHYDIHTALISYHDHSKEERIQELVAHCRTGDVALVSDAGMPGLSDPGYRLIQAALDAGIQVSPIPGPAAAVAGLVASGLPTDKFLFLGFLPRQKNARQTALRDVAALPITLVLYEAPHRLEALLTDAAQALGPDRTVVIARELTKKFEEFWRGTIAEALAAVKERDFKGEMTVCFHGAPPTAAKWDEPTVVAALEDLLASGLSRKDAAAQIAEASGWRKRDVYQLSLK